MASVEVGSKVPEFTAPATGGKDVSLSDFAGKAKLVLYFYPKDNTPGCTREGQDFRDLHAAFEAAGCVILGVSRDSVRVHEGFRERQGFPFDLLSDKEEALCGLFDVIREKNMYGKKVLGVERSTFLIDREGVLREAWRKVRVPGHVEQVLEAARGL